MHSFYEEVEGLKIHYEKLGTGEQVVLLIPGSVGCGRIHYVDQLTNDGFDQDLFTIIVIDVPGWGKSRPPERILDKDTFNNDVRIAALLMDKLGYKLYSVLGWSYGGRIALMMAIRYQERVEKLVVWGASPHMTKSYVDCMAMLRRRNTYDYKYRHLYISIYGFELYEQLWHEYVDFILTYADNPQEMWDVRKDLRCIRCPTLILHGERDPLVDKKDLSVAEAEIPNVRLVFFPTGSHDFHRKFPEEFNNLVNNFLIE